MIFGLTGSYAQEAGKAKIAPKAKETKVEQKETTKADVKQSTATKPKSGKPLKGKVISLSKFVLDGKGIVKKEEAMKEADEGKPIVFLVGEGKKAKVYFVFNEDGSFAGKKLAKFADNNFVGIIGKTKVVNGLNIIIAEMIESMD
ncbi:hypothetical protein D9V84_09645 [Bacteroidetes/Chlorobi group bacterium Naka2016]|nr:MAG: hypothetical protein D9V84_09645 [Bacteroidetes/Chlorobi group bacterium Naka2016]